MDRKDILHFVGGKLGRVAKDIFYAILIMELEDYITKDQHYFEEELQSECLFDILTILSFNITRLFMIKLNANPSYYKKRFYMSNREFERLKEDLEIMKPLDYPKEYPCKDFSLYEQSVVDAF